MIDYILNPQSVEALGWTLLHSLWIGAVFALVMVLVLIALRTYSAQSRYVVSVGLLCAFFLTLSGTFWLQMQEANSRMEMAELGAENTSTIDANVWDNNEASVLAAMKSQGNALVAGQGIEATSGSTWVDEFREYYQQHLPLLVTLWFLGILFLQLRFLGQLAYVQRLKHYGTQLFPSSWKDKIDELEGKLRIQKKVKYLTSLRIESPMVVGWLKPVILMPQQLFNSLSETEIYAVLAHELAHIRREDFIVNLMQTFLCNVFFFHPGIWWMSNRIDDEREHCCDDLAVAATGPATSYAKTLINVSTFQLNKQSNTQLAMALSGNKKRERGGFSARIKRLFTTSKTSSFREGFATAFILFMALGLGVLATGTTIHPDEHIQGEIAKKEIKTEEVLPTEVVMSVESPVQINTEITTTTTTMVNESERVGMVINKSVPHCAPSPEEKPSVPQKPMLSDDVRIDDLMTACLRNDMSIVKSLVAAGVNVNGIGSEGFTPLMMATGNERVKIVRYLLENGADINQNYKGWTALIEAADEGSYKSMQLLLKSGADVNYYKDKNNPTAISVAASEGHLECLKLLLKNGAEINGKGNSVPPLHLAANEDKDEIIDYLLSQNVNVNKQDAEGRTALMFAASEGNKQVVLQLIDADADDSIKDIYGNTAMDYVESDDPYDTYDALSTNPRDQKPYTIHQLTKDGLIEKVQKMVQNGANVNSRDDYGRTALHIASAEGHNIDMRVLIELGADINAQDQHNRTPLMYAAADGKRNAVVLLVSEEANVQIKDVDGMRAYEWAQSSGNDKLANFLGLITENKDEGHHDIWDKEEQKREAKQQHKNESFHIYQEGTHLRQYNIKEKNTALLDAVRSGSMAECVRLINNGLSANDGDDTGQTPLMVAVRMNRLDIATFLIEHGADVNMSSASGLTALHYAALENHGQMARLLLDNEAFVDPTLRYSSTDGNYTNEPIVWEYFGATPLLIAVESGNEEVVTILISAGANKQHTLVRNEYKLNENRESYLTASEVMGIDVDFLNDVKFQSSDEAWTPLKQAILLNQPEIIKTMRN